MSPPFVALGITLAIVGATIAFALLSVRRLPADPQEYLVGSRNFGTFFLWVLLAGEIYTSFSFLGAAGWAYGFGAPAFYILAYGTCGYIISYFTLPRIWAVAKERGLLTAPDFFADRYRSRVLGIAVAVLQFLTLIPYVALQISGLEHILTIAGYGRIDATLAAAVAFGAIALFVFTAGLRGTAWASIVKDALMIGGVIFAGIAIPVAFFGSPGAMFDQLLRTHPQMLSLAHGSAPKGTIWYVTTVLLTGIAFYNGPQSFNAIYSARSENVLRRNAVALPLYSVALLLVFFAGFAALLVIPGLRGTDVDSSFLLVVQRYYPPWAMGAIAGAGALAALVPSAALLLAAAGLFAKNVLGDAFGIATGDKARTLATRLLVIVVAGMALGLWLLAPKTIGELLLIYYNGIAQFTPGILGALYWPRATAWGVAAGIVSGLSVAIYFAATNNPLWGINPGFAGLVVNVAVMAAVSLAMKKREPAG